MRRIDKERRKKEGVLGLPVHRGIHYRRVEGFYGHDGEMEYEFAKAWEKENIPKSYLNFGHGVLQNLLTKEDTKYHLFHRQVIHVNRRDAAVAAEVIQWLGSNCGFAFLGQVMRASGYELKRVGESHREGFWEEMGLTHRIHYLGPKLSRIEIYNRLRSISNGGHTDVCGVSIYHRRSWVYVAGELVNDIENWSASCEPRDSPYCKGVSAAVMARWLYERHGVERQRAQSELDALLEKRAAKKRGDVDATKPL